jgi:hypothetical protein
VNLLLKLLPTLINLGMCVSKSIRAEVAYLQGYSPRGYVFQIKVDRTAIECVCHINQRGRLHRVPKSQQALDVPFGSGLSSADPSAFTVDYVIAFRSLEYAFSCFCGASSLKEALAQRAFTTRGPNDTGVALTYLCAALLRGFFFWRRPYRTR